MNLLTAMGNCFYDSVPCVFMTGQINSRFLRPDPAIRQIGFQETDIVAMAAPVTKYAKMILKPEDVRYELEKALWLCQEAVSYTHLVSGVEPGLRRHRTAGLVWFDRDLPATTQLLRGHSGCRGRGVEPPADGGSDPVSYTHLLPPHNAPLQRLRFRRQPAKHASLIAYRAQRAPCRYDNNPLDAQKGRLHSPSFVKRRSSLVRRKERMA